MTIPCTHTRTGLVTSHRMHGAFETVEPGPHAQTPVCDLPACIDEATKWVVRMTTGRPAFYIRDSEVRS